jgi:Na+/H+-dicarboxylate symporter
MCPDIVRLAHNDAPASLGKILLCEFAISVYEVVVGVASVAGALSTFHLPMGGVAVLSGVDAVLDMTRTSINVLGNCLASAVVARWEGEA